MIKKIFRILKILIKINLVVKIKKLNFTLRKKQGLKNP